MSMSWNLLALAFLAALMFGLAGFVVLVVMLARRGDIRSAPGPVRRPTPPPAARPVAVPTLTQILAVGGVAALAVAGVLAVVVGIPAWERMEEAGHIGPVEYLILGSFVVAYGLAFFGLLRAARGPAAVPTPPEVEPVVAMPVPDAVPAAPRTCPKCGQSIAPGAPQGLCPRCLLQGVMPSPPGKSPTLAFATAYVAPPVEEVARLFPHLEVIQLVGQGGMGAVYLARQPALDRFVALKLLRPHDDDPTFAERFAREAKALARLSHPNVVTVHESGEAGGLPYLVMEYVDGPTLRDAMREKKLTPAEALAIIPQICDALDYAHRQGVVHRDVKPENILLTGVRGEGPGASTDAASLAPRPSPLAPLCVKIADFGLAKVADPAGVSLTGTQQAMGTPHYMAPEQWEKPSEVDHRADIYALGVVLYELLTGELPLGRFDPPSQKIRLDVRIDEVVLRALAKEPDRRYQHASDVKNDLERIESEPGYRGCRWGGPLREYKSKATFLGLPLVHVVSGRDPITGRPKTAKGWIAVGDGLAVGGIAVGGGGAVGVLAVAGGFAAGGLAIAGGGALGVFALAGGMAIAAIIAVAGGFAAAQGLAVAGGFAAAWQFAWAGGNAAARWVWSSTRQDPGFGQQLGDWLRFWEADPTDW